MKTTIKPPAFLPQYLLRNLDILKTLRGSKIKNMWRLSSLPDNDLLRTYEPILIETGNTEKILIDHDEGMSNLVLVDDIQERVSIENSIDKSLELNSIISDFDSDILTDYNFNLTIDDIKIVTYQHEFLGWCLMSGLEFIFSDGKVLTLGTCLTELEIQGIWIISSTEIESMWQYIHLADSDNYYGLSSQAEEIDRVT
jgi:hypothetical protein